MNAKVVSVAEAMRRKICATSIATRRSEMSAIAPAGNDNNMMGSVVEAWTSATICGEGARDVISHAAPTDSMSPPKLETRLAAQMETKMRDLKGASVADVRHEAGSLLSNRERSTVQPIVSRGRYVHRPFMLRSGFSVC